MVLFDTAINASYGLDGLGRLAIEQRPQRSRAERCNVVMADARPQTAVRGDDRDVRVRRCASDLVDDRVVPRAVRSHDPYAWDVRHGARLTLDNEDDVRPHTVDRSAVVPVACTGMPSTASRASDCARRSVAPARSRHHPSGRLPTTLAASTMSTSCRSSNGVSVDHVTRNAGCSGSWGTSPTGTQRSCTDSGSVARAVSSWSARASTVV